MEWHETTTVREKSFTGIGASARRGGFHSEQNLEVCIARRHNG